MVLFSSGGGAVVSVGDVRVSICDAGVVIVFAPAAVSLLCNQR